MPSRILVFAGAGASKAVDPTQFPTTVEFFERLPAEVIDDKYFQFVMRYLSSENGERLFDIEHVLWGLQEFYSIFADFQRRKGVLGFCLGQNVLSLANSQHGFGHLQNTAPTIAAGFKQVIEKINQQVYEFYAAEPSPAELNGNWIKLIEGLRGERERLDIFTTNYDSVIEAALVHLDGDGTGRLDCGISGTLRQRLNFDYWTDDAKPEDILLTKLHGSLDWKYTDKGVAVGDPVFTGDHQKQAIVYPGFKGTSDAIFFPLFHEYLRRAVSECDVVIFVGFAFRDDHINDIFRDALSSNTRIISINPDDKACLPIGRVDPLYVRDGFGPKTVKAVLEEALKN